jgi:hypothetical protein
MTEALAARHLRERRTPNGVFETVLDFEEPEFPPSPGTVVGIVPGNDLFKGRRPT